MIYGGIRLILQVGWNQPVNPELFRYVCVRSFRRERIVFTAFFEDNPPQDAIIKAVIYGEFRLHLINNVSLVNKIYLIYFISTTLLNTLHSDYLIKMVFLVVHGDICLLT